MPHPLRPDCPSFIWSSLAWEVCFFFIHLFLESFIPISVMLHYSVVGVFNPVLCYIFCGLIFFTLCLWETFQVDPAVPLSCPHHCVLWVRSFFLEPWDFPNSSCIFPALLLELVIFLGNLSGEEGQKPSPASWVSSLLLGNTSSRLSPLTMSETSVMFTNRRALGWPQSSSGFFCKISWNTHLQLPLYVSICFYAKPNMSPCWRLQV